MASLSEIAAAGLHVSKNGGGAKAGSDIVQAFIGGAQKSAENQEKQQKREAEKFSFYATLRSSGYSKEEAEEKVNKVFTEKQPFLSRVFGKEKELFKAPDKQSIADQKASLGLEEQKARIKKLQAEANNGGLNPKDARSQKIAKQRALELIQSKQAYSRQFGGSVPLKTKADVLAALNGITGGVDTEDPDIKAALDRAFPRDSGGADTEAMIVANMQRYGKSREEVVQALKSKGLIK